MLVKGAVQTSDAEFDRWTATLGKQEAESLGGCMLMAVCETACQFVFAVSVISR